MSRIFITTSNGLFCFDERTQKLEVAIQKRRGFWPVKRPSYGFFGLDNWNGKLLVASRERLGSSRAGKHSSDVRIFLVDKETLQYFQYMDIHDVHDVHQICLWKDLLILTDTGQNRILIYDLKSKAWQGTLLVGDVRSDVNHLNAITINQQDLLIGLNNQGAMDSQILSIPLEKIETIDKQEIDAIGNGTLIELPGLTHSHDIEPWQEQILLCSSHEGKIYTMQPLKMCLKAMDWVRGLTVTEKAIWVGASALADRKKRHKENVDSMLMRYSLPDFEKEFEIVLKGAGQVNDIII
ncbi:MAG: hypothetical protein IH946_00355 [Bacteroidetes bacterium]|nr:hypothetical protein [Bacteroidota bacterium]